MASPTVRDVMWSAWKDALADAAADSPDRMPWERKRAATAITQESAHLAMAMVLEATTDIDLRHRIRDIMPWKPSSLSPRAPKLSFAIGSEPQAGADQRWLRLSGKTFELDGGICHVI